MLLSRSNDRSRFGEYFSRRLVHAGEKSLVMEAAGVRDVEPVAIKLYTGSYDRLAKKLEKKYGLLSEAEVGRILNPGGPAHADSRLVATLGAGTEYGRRRGNRYIVQEFVSGATLKKLIYCKDKRVKEHRRNWTRQLCLALKEVHCADLIYRDMCSDNIIVDESGRIKLIDLGFVAPPGIAFEERGGTPSYMAPEQVQALPLSQQADIYSLGAVIYEMLAGSPPYTAGMPGDSESARRQRQKNIMQQHISEPAPQLPEHAARQYPELSEIAARCLRKKPADRFRDVDEILNALRG